MGFINDLIHLTKGEFLIKYWWLYTILFGTVVLLYIFNTRNK
jgi:hypothetical protein